MQANSGDYLSQLTKEIIAEGREKLHLIFDFDRTLTIGKDGSSLASTCFSMFREQGTLGENYTQTSTALFNTYHPLEISHTVSNDEKTRAMDEWWKKHLELLVAHKLSKADFKNTVNNGNVKLRKYVKEVFEICRQKNIPIIILSAGLGDLITCILEKEKINHSNVTIVSNWFLFEGDTVVGYKTPFIHATNKDEDHLSQQVKESLIGRNNIVLAGDSLSDLKMLPSQNTGRTITFGFLNGAQNLLPEFKKNFDHVEESIGADFGGILKIVNEI